MRDRKSRADLESSTINARLAPMSAPCREKVRGAAQEFTQSVKRR
jgi:hypothetical protein